MFFDPFPQRHVPNWQHPKETVKCWRCGLRFVKHYSAPPHGNGLCKFCDVAEKRGEWRPSLPASR